MKLLCNQIFREPASFAVHCAEEPHADPLSDTAFHRPTKYYRSNITLPNCTEYLRRRRTVMEMDGVLGTVVSTLALLAPRVCNDTR